MTPEIAPPEDPSPDTSSPSSLSQLEDVSGYFRCNMDYEAEETSDPQMAKIAPLASNGLQIASQFDPDVELGALERFALFSENEQFWVFGISTLRDDQTTENNIFGLKMPTMSSISHKIDELSVLS